MNVARDEDASGKGRTPDDGITGLRAVSAAEAEQGLRDGAARLTSLVARAVPGATSPFREEVVTITLDRIEKPFTLGVMGEFRAGKSTLINALTGLPLALTDVVETTATLNEYRHGAAVTASVVLQDGSSETMGISDLNALLDRRRRDQAWLGTVSHVIVTAPSAFLERFSIWDSPGLGGSGFNEELARKFLERLDAALWVFDLDFLGGQGLQASLDELGRRGKTVVALLNKAEGRSLSEIARAAQYLALAHDGIRFHSILPLSAARAVHGPEEGAEDAVGPDGGLGRLVSLLTEDVLAEPRLLTVQAVAGDLAALATSLQQVYEEEASQRRRMLWLLDQQRDGIQLLGEQTAQEAVRTICGGLLQRFPEVLCSRFAEEVEKADAQNLQNKTWVMEAFSRVLNQERLRGIVRDYLSESEPFLIAAWERAAARVQRELGGRLTQGDIASVLDHASDVLPILEWTWNSGAAPATDAVQDRVAGEARPSDKPGTFLTAGGVLGGLVSAGGALEVGGTLGDFIHAAAVGALTGGVMTLPLVLLSVVRRSATGVIQEFSRQPDMPVEAQRSQLINLAAEQFTQLSREELCPLVEAQLVGPALERLRQQFCDVLMEAARKQILGTLPEAVARDEEAVLAHVGREAWALTEKFYGLSGAPAQAIRSTILLREAMTFEASDRAALERLLERIFTSAIARLDIADAAFSAGAFPLLRFARDSTPIRLLAYDQPLSASLREDFTQALTTLRRRPGPVRVRVPLHGAEQTCPLPEKGAWIFTDTGAFSLSTSLSAVGRTTTTITPHADYGELHEEHFARWWEERVANAQAQDVR